MGIDAVALLRPKHLSKLSEHVDLTAPETLIQPLDDGALLFHTFIRYRELEHDPDLARAWLTRFGDDLPELHDDPRGVLFFPDITVPRGRTYEAVVREVGGSGSWVPASMLSPEEQAARHAATMAGVEAIMKIAQAAQRGEPVPAGYGWQAPVLPSPVELGKQVDEVLASLGMTKASPPDNRKSSGRPPKKRK